MTVKLRVIINDDSDLQGQTIWIKYLDLFCLVRIVALYCRSNQICNLQTKKLCVRVQHITVQHSKRLHASVKSHTLCAIYSDCIPPVLIHLSCLLTYLSSTFNLSVFYLYFHLLFLFPLSNIFSFFFSYAFLPPPSIHLRSPLIHLSTSCLSRSVSLRPTVENVNHTFNNAS